MLAVPTRFFVSSGEGISEASDLNAFDRALIDASVGEANLVPVSSVLPAGIKQLDDPVPVTRGAITPCVLAQQRGTEGETISAGIAYARRVDHEGGYVAEGHGHMREEAMREILEWKMNEIAKARDVEIDTIHYEIRELRVPMDHYGVTLASLVFMR